MHLGGCDPWKDLIHDAGAQNLQVIQRGSDCISGHRAAVFYLYDLGELTLAVDGPFEGGRGAGSAPGHSFTGAIFFRYDMYIYSVHMTWASWVGGLLPALSRTRVVGWGLISPSPRAQFR